jgi:predicted permease
MAEVTARSLPPPEQAAMASVRIDVESGANGFSVMAREWGPSFRVVLGLTAILLGVAIVNLTGLMSSRMLARRQEIAMCLALGSGPLRMMRRLLVEGIMLAVLALAAALPVAWSLSAVLEAMLTLGRSSPLLKPMTPDGAVMMVAVIMALGLGIAVGVLPAWGAVKASEADVVRSGRGIVPSLGRSGRAVLVTQVALSMVLLVGAGLFVTMLANLHRHDAAFRGSDVVWTRLTRVPGTQRTPLTAEYYRTLVEQLQAIPGAKGAVLNFYFPAFLGFRGGFPVDRYTRVESPEATPVTGLTEIVTPGFFEFFGITRMRGRDFTWDDDGTRPGVAIASRSLAEGLWGGTDAIGRRVRVQAGSSVTDLEIVGIVEDAPIGSIREPRRAVLFRPLLQDLGRGQAALAHVRVNRLRGAREGYVRAVESQGQHYVRGFFTLEEWLDNALLQERLIAGVSAFAASMALLLAGLGVYGALAYAVVSRVREIGVRMALGASRQSVVRMIVRDGLAVVVPGVAAGIPIAVGAALLIRSQLSGVSPTDPATIAAAAGVFVVTGVAAAWLPARRAARIEPSEALRQE